MTLQDSESSKTYKNSCLKIKEINLRSWLILEIIGSIGAIITGSTMGI